MVCKKLTLFIVLLSVSLFVFGQNGKLVSKIPFSLPDTTVQRIAKRFPEIQGFHDSTTAYQISYLSDGLIVNGYMVTPKMPGKYPCVIYNRGGNREFGKLDHGDYGYYMPQIASWGYVVVASQYRGNGGSEGREEFGGRDVNDVINLMAVLSSIREADTSRIGMYGVSRGGMMTYIALKKTSRLKAAVSISGIADLIKLIDTRPAMDTGVYRQLIPNYQTAKMKALRERSAVYFADSLSKTTPLLILQGTADWRVPTDQVIDLASKLYQAKVPFRFSLFEGGTHGVDEYWDEVSHQVRLFLATYLRDKAQVPSLKPHGF